MLLGINQFLLDFPICWHIAVQSILIIFLYFCGIDDNMSSFIFCVLGPLFLPIFFKDLFILFFACGGCSLLHISFLWLLWTGAALSCGGQASHCSNFSCGMQAQSAGFSSCGSWALERWLNSCGAKAELLCSMWDFPGPGIKLIPLALQGIFLTTGPPGKPLSLFLMNLQA